MTMLEGVMSGQPATTADVVRELLVPYLSKNQVAEDRLPGFIESVHDAVLHLYHVAVEIPIPLKGKKTELMVTPEGQPTVRFAGGQLGGVEGIHDEFIVRNSDDTVDVMESRYTYAIEKLIPKEHQVIKDGRVDLHASCQHGPDNRGDYLICLECGKLDNKMLKRHLYTAHAGIGYSSTMTTDEIADLYSQRWGISPKFPMIASNYSQERSTVMAEHKPWEQKKAASSPGAEGGESSSNAVPPSAPAAKTTSPRPEKKASASRTAAKATVGAPAVAEPVKSASREFSGTLRVGDLVASGAPKKSGRPANLRTKQKVGDEAWNLGKAMVAAQKESEEV